MTDDKLKPKVNVKNNRVIPRLTRRSFVEHLTTAIVTAKDKNDISSEDEDVNSEDSVSSSAASNYNSNNNLAKCNIDNNTAANNNNNINNINIVKFANNKHAGMTETYKPARFKPQIIYSCAFTINELDVSVLHTEHNYIQLTGKNLSGAIESRAERENSRECVQMDVLTEAISARLKRRLREWASAARERALQSRYATPPSTSAQLQLYSTASFFAGELLVHYTSDAMVAHPLPFPHKNKETSASVEQMKLPTKNNKHQTSRDNRKNTKKSSERVKKAAAVTSSHQPFEPLSFNALNTSNENFNSSNTSTFAQKEHKRTGKPNHARTFVQNEIPVLTGVVEQVTVVVQFAEQYDQYGEQVNVHVVMQRSKLESPLRQRANETVHPQVREFITA